MFRSFQKTLSGSSETLTSGTSVSSADWTIQADSANTQLVFIGGQSGQFFELAPGDSISLSEIGSRKDAIFSSEDIYVRGTAGDKVNVLIGG